MAAEDDEIAKTEEVSSCLQAIAMCHLLIAFLLPTSRFVQQSGVDEMTAAEALRDLQTAGAAVAKCQAESSGSGASAGTAVQPAEKVPASSAADMTDMDNPEYLGQLAATFAPGG